MNKQQQRHLLYPDFMPFASSRTPPRAIALLAIAFAAVAALLWLLPLLSSRPILFPAGPNFADVLVYKGRFALYHSARFFTSRAYSAFAYPPGAAPIYRALYNTADATQSYLILAAAAIVTAVAYAFLYLRRLAATILFLPLLLLSFPLIFLIQRGNIELILWIVIAAGIVAYRRGYGILAAVLFGLTGAVKLYPILLLGLFVKPSAHRSRQDSPALLVGLLTALLTTAAAIAFTGPTFAIAARGFFHGVDRFQGRYVDTVTKTEIVFDHCLFSPLKYLAYTQHLSPAGWRTSYYLCAAILALLLFLRLHRLPFLNRLIFLVTAMVCLPPVSFTYTLVHLYLPMLWLLGAVLSAGKRPPATAIVAFLVLVFLLLPLPALTTLGTVPTGPIQAAALLFEMILCVVSPWQDRSGPATL